MDIEVVKIAKLSKISRQSINQIIKSIRILIAKECEKISILKEIEINESYFLLCFTCNYNIEGMLKRNGCVYTQIVKNCSTSELLPILQDSSNLQ